MILSYERVSYVVRARLLIPSLPRRDSSDAFHQGEPFPRWLDR